MSVKTIRQVSWPSNEKGIIHSGQTVSSCKTVERDTNFKEFLSKIIKVYFLLFRWPGEKI